MVVNKGDGHWHERRLGRTLLRAYRCELDIDDVFPNEQQPRMGPKEDLELQRQIVANEGLFEPILVEPHPEHQGRYRIIDGDRRWTNSKILVEAEKKDQYRRVPAEIIDRTLTDDERLRVWIYIHRQRKEWDAKDKEMVAYRLVELVGRASAANILGITVRALDKLIDVFELSRKLTNLPDPSSAITWSREIQSISKKLLTPRVLDQVVQRINENEITNSKDIRKLRKVLRDPIAKSAFLESRQPIDDSLQLVVSNERKAKKSGLIGDIEALSDCIKNYPWTTIADLKSNPNSLEKIEEATSLLRKLRESIEATDSVDEAKSLPSD